jgi:CTP:molybdopterin cytidylyltransferase MocA
MIFAVIPAAGQSTRMGQPKLALPFAGRTVLEHVITALRNGGAQHVVVVTGPHVSELNPLAKRAGADVHAVSDQTPDMRATIEHGLRWLEQRHAPQAADAVLLAPGDHPAFSADLVRRLCEAYSGLRSPSIVVPVHAGRRGHPVLIAWKHVPGVLAMAPDRGVNAYLRQQATDVQELPVDESGVLFNLDAPEDYIALQRSESLFSAKVAATCLVGPQLAPTGDHCRQTQ